VPAAGAPLALAKKVKEITENPLKTALERALAEGAGDELVRAVRARKDITASEAVLPLMVAVAYRSMGGPLLVAAPTEAERLADDIDAFLPGEVFNMPGGALSGDWFRPYDECVGDRMKAARALRSGGLVVAGPEALMGGLPGEMPEPWPLTISKDMTFDLEELLKELVDGGYQREYMVEGWGKFAVRGGILDIFPSTADRPIRIEMVGDSVESLREFNVVTQRSSDHVAGIEVFPASDQVASAGSGTVEGTRVLAINPGLIEARAAEYRIEEGSAAEPVSLDEWGEVTRVTTAGGEPGAAVFPGGPVREFRGDLHAAVKEWGRLLESMEVFLLLDGKGQVDRARELWLEEGKGRGAPQMAVGTLSRGFEVPGLGMAVITTADVIGKREPRRAHRRLSSGAPVTSYAELEVDGYVVHVDQGIGFYRGLTSRKVMGVTREYLLLEYADGDRLYVPTAQLEKVQRYVGGESPKVHKLRGKEWSRSRKTAKRSAEKTARQLFGLYMERKSRLGFAFSTDTPWQVELEDSFEYEDTPDQARAAADVKSDMENQTAMDRLVCGDVGYGKTEVAVRAAMKAAMDSKQVAVLVPTTVLAKQHFETFRERMAPFPVRVEMLSRFLTKKEQEKVVRLVRSGKVDVLIGTHRMLQDDVSFSDLGLLIVDEEQKFGVENKERLRRISRNVDTLTLTATPIPRTLQMSLSGVRDISMIDTPPEDRHPVATYVGEFDMDLCARAISYEVARSGQVFYVHNRVQTINRVADELEKKLDGVSIGVAHGQMDEDALERVMLEFADGIYSVLVCTTIIESGLDLPNVNTLIADRADRLGLAQMYQIRGRVGRAGRRAYAYLFFPHRAALTPSATARLATITDMTALGSGMRVAMRDLEIRGAGSLLGAEQSGQIEAVGFELYCELLREAVDLLKGEATPAAKEAVVELPVDAYIPEEYVTDEEARVELYRRLVVAGRAGALDELSSEMEDRFGEPPVPVEQMLAVERLKYQAAEAGLQSVTLRGKELAVQYEPDGERVATKLKMLASFEGPVESAYTEEGSRTVYLRLSLDVNKRQELLLKWLKSTIDDIIDARPADASEHAP